MPLFSSSIRTDVCRSRSIPGEIDDERLGFVEVGNRLDRVAEGKERPLVSSHERQALFHEHSRQPS